MRCLPAAFFLALWVMPVGASAATDGVVCGLEPSSIVSQSPSGIDQVSNVGDIRVHCSIPAKPVTLKPGESLSAVSTKTARASLLLPTGAVQEVPAEVIGIGGGNDRTRAWVDFYLHLPLDAPQREAEARRALSRLDAETAKEGSRPPAKVTGEDRQKMVSMVAQEMVFQHRAGRFRVECRLMQGDQFLGTGELTFEVLDKGRFSDLWPFPVSGK